MRIALIHDSILPAKNYGGIERVVMSLAREYKRMGHHVIVVCREGSPLENFETALLPKGFSLKQVETALPSSVDFLHFHQPIHEKPNKPYLITVHGNAQPGETFLPNANFLSRSHARDHNSQIYVYNGVDAEDFPFVESKQNYFVFLARAKWRVKNLKTAIAMSRELGVRLEVIGGEGISTSAVRYHGSLNEKQGKLEILAGAKALLYPTNWPEPFGLALLEAWSCGTPVISSVNGAMDELVQPGTGFKCRNYKEFLEAGTQINSVRPSDCRRHVLTQFSSVKMAQGYLELIERILREGELKQTPRYAYTSESTTLLYKPTLLNRVRLQLTGKV